MTEITIDMNKLGKAGGTARAASQTAEELSAIGIKGANARWDKVKAEKLKIEGKKRGRRR